jgi:hypothetical protein
LAVFDGYVPVQAGKDGFAGQVVVADGEFVHSA